MFALHRGGADSPGASFPSWLEPEWCSSCSQDRKSTYGPCDIRSAANFAANVDAANVADVNVDDANVDQNM